jgi:hypothetical protein
MAGVTFSPDWRRLAVAANHGAVIIWEADQPPPDVLCQREALSWQRR